MRYSKLFYKVSKNPPKQAESVNHRLLVQAGFIDQLMAGSWTLLPLGWRVVVKINQIIREEMNAIGGQEMLMPLLHPRSIWDETGRWDKAGGIMYKLKDSRGKEFALSFTHEEVVMDLLRKKVKSYQDLPIAVYHFSTKFRNEPRARSGILRGREFLMKDLYSAHTDEQDLMKFYEKTKQAYVKVFTRLGFKDLVVTEAEGGVFTDKNTHEFQVLAPGGEDKICYCEQCRLGQNQEIFKGKIGAKCPLCGKGKMKQARSIEVGNIFPLGQWYAEKMQVYYTDKQGKRQLVWFGSYGIGPTRVLGALAEVFHDKKGIIWPKQVAPYQVQLVSLEGTETKAKKYYQQLQQAGIEVLWDDRETVTAGVKLVEADLIGVPVRLVVSDKTKDKLEWKSRDKDETSLLKVEAVIKRLTD